MPPDVCPACGRVRRRPPTTRLRRALEELDDQWATVRTGASRWLVHKLRTRYPAFEFRATRVTLHGGSHGAWTIEARRRTP